MPTNYHLVQTLVLKCFKGDHKVIRCKNSLQMVLKVFLIPSALLNDVSNKGIQIKIRYFEKKKTTVLETRHAYFSLSLIILSLIHKVSFIEE